MISSFRRIWSWIERLRSRRLLPGAIRHGGLIRNYLLYVPRHFQGKAALPLVLVFHGGAGQPAAIARVTEMHRIAEREGFIVAYPAGTPGRLGLTWNPRGLGLGPDVDDVDFVRTLIAELKWRYDIDPRRVYAAGMSIGGSLVYQLACALSDGIAAIAVVAGVMMSEDCNPAYPVSVIHIHGTADRRVPLRGGRGRFTAWHNNWPPVQQGLERWYEFNRCSGPDQVIREGDGLICRRRAGAADVELWLVEGGRHVWPGGAADDSGPRRRRVPTGSFSASEKVWSFFAAHPRRGQ